jgi:cell division protein FtsB
MVLSCRFHIKNTPLSIFSALSCPTTQEVFLKTQNSKLKTQNSKLKTQNSKLKTQNLKLKTQNLKLKTAATSGNKTGRHN